MITGIIEHGDPAWESDFKCPFCGEDICEDELTDKGCVYCSSTCEWCSHHDSNEDTHFIKCNVRKPGEKTYTAMTLCEDCYTILWEEGDVEGSIIDLFECLNPEI